VTGNSSAARVRSASLGDLCFLPLPADAAILAAGSAGEPLYTTAHLCSATVCASCGNGIKEGSEACDDGACCCCARTEQARHCDNGVCPY
jgi:hypothetical protein